MSLKNQWIISITMIILSWLSLPFYGWRQFKRFLPASMLIVVFEAINVKLVKNKKWWIFYNKPNSYFNNEFPFNIGPFIVSSLWGLKWSFGNLRKFLVINAAINIFFAFIYITILEKIKIARLVKINKFQFFLYFYYKAFLLYGIQYFFENKTKLLK
ncbi:hypothetical protein [Metabacillus sp. Hm71]|uniref:hypothetical protein n=1 Tax=Metabacillus sp. Hm71 TaxID=3450743 RepID=UPI003F42DCE3